MEISPPSVSISCPLAAWLWAALSKHRLGLQKARAAALVQRAALGTDIYGKRRSKRTANRKHPGACVHILKVGETSRQQNRMARECFHSLDSC